MIDNKVKSIRTIKEISTRNGKSWSWKKGQVIIMPAFKKNGGPVDAFGLGCPRSRTGKQEAFQAVADWLVKIGVKTICGPVLSGAQMAYVVALLSGWKLNVAFLPKPGGQGGTYKPGRHGNSMVIHSPYAIIDDIIFTGRALKKAISIAKRWSNNSDPTAIIVGDVNASKNDMNNLYFVSAKFSELIINSLYIVSAKLK